MRSDTRYKHGPFIPAACTPTTPTATSPVPTGTTPAATTPTSSTSADAPTRMVVVYFGNTVLDPEVDCSKVWGAARTH
ncbi:MAG TPA: hypothetical protein PKJ61_03845 [Propionicimonas sp.]|nr:hypothetical protein [Propionicimonas sp.]